ncbi:MAG: hypothetical protein B6244_02565 [Candidatus Cloacimonetes bacterium 4572_55]|nr:MAG: hypothetical protein B6244_02565 [Candidatus Cloacimonetes bacterium 4572_55]
MEKYLMILTIFALFLPAIAFGQIQVTVATDQDSYLPGDPVTIYITAHNPTDQMIDLWWPSSCQAAYFIDSYDVMLDVTCFMTITEMHLLPGASHTWELTHHPYQYVLTPGVHSVVGRVLDYEISAPLHIVVETGNLVQVPGDYPTIQEALDGADFGDTVLVAPGIYSESVTFPSRDVVLGSHFLTTGDAWYIDQTVIQGMGGSVVSFNDFYSRAGELVGFTITGGIGSVLNFQGEIGAFGGGICIRDASPTIRHNKIVENHTPTDCSGRGGGIAILGLSEPLIINNEITNNSTIGDCDWINYFGGGIWVDQYSFPVIGGSLDHANIIMDNEADSGWQLYRFGEGIEINAQYNYFGNCPPAELEIFPINQFDVSNCLDQSLSIEPEIVEQEDAMLFQNHPNPFNPNTTISFQLEHPSNVNLSVYNQAGQLVETLFSGHLSPGPRHTVWQADQVGSGVYFYRLTTDRGVLTRRAILIK